MNVIKRLIEFSMSKEGRQLRRRSFTTAAAVVVFVTTYMLILPAITKTAEVYCGKEEHTHTDACWTVEDMLICTQEENAGHIHSDDCYCVMDEELICGQEEVYGHVHTDACWNQQQVLICMNEDPEHEHDDSCYEFQSTLICDEEEVAGHTHTPDCYRQNVELVCGMEESQGHIHDESCYTQNRTQVCELEEHVHDLTCFADTEADLEDEETWTKNFRSLELTGNWSEDVLAIAKTQLGYHESADNYKVDEAGETKGYSRYGAWYGDPYGDWDAMFVSFCLYYAGIPSSEDTAIDMDGRAIYFPITSGCQYWIEQLKREATPYYQAANKGTEPEPGNLIFFNCDSDSDSDHVGLVYSVERDPDGKLVRIQTIEGDTDKAVAYVDYEPDDDRIMGYAILPENPLSQEAENGQMLESEPAESESGEGETETAESESDEGETELAENETGEGETEAAETEDPIIEDEPENSDEQVKETKTFTAEYENYKVTVTLTAERNVSEETSASEETGVSEETSAFEETGVSEETSASEETGVSEETGAFEETNAYEESEATEFFDEFEDRADNADETTEAMETIVSDEQIAAAHGLSKNSEDSDDNIWIPAGVVFEAEQISDAYDQNRVEEFLGTDYTYTGMTDYNIRFALDGETYKVDLPAEVDIAVQIPEDEDQNEELARAMVLQLNSEDEEKLAVEITEEEGWRHYHYKQTALTKIALITGVIGNHTLSYEGEDYAVIVSYTDEAKLPENTALSVSEILGDEFQEKCEALNDVAQNENIQYVRIFDITFTVDGTEVEPEAPVQVQIIRKDLTDLTESMEPGVVHFGEEETEYIESELTTDEEGTAMIEFESTSFSSYASFVSDPFAGESNTPATIETVDTVALGLTINMFDYWGDEVDKNWTNGAQDYRFNGVNSVYPTNNVSQLTKNLYFSTSGTAFDKTDTDGYRNDGQYQKSLNAFTGGENGTHGAARQGIINSTLTNGYPTLATQKDDNGLAYSLAYLFDPSMTKTSNGTTYKESYTGLNHLFKDMGNGYIRYSSNENYAYLDKATKNFKVYKQTYENSDSKENEKSWIGFFPFNEYNANKTHVKTPEEAYYNHHFGLTLNGTFVMPEGKQVEGKNIIFSFSGDDDMWLFIDGVLVMDIGGIHQPCDGEINLTTGKITISEAVSTAGGASYTMGIENTIQNLFERAGKIWDDSVDSKHVVQVFYMERGGCYSNLTMEMNFPFYTEVPIKIQKDLEGEYREEELEKNKEYTFKLMIETRTGLDEYQTYGVNAYEPYNGELVATDVNGKKRNIYPDPTTGEFSIKAGEVVETTIGILSTKRYYVMEVAPDGTTYSAVEFKDTGNNSVGTVESTNGNASVTSGKIYTSHMTKINNVIREERKDLKVLKEWYDGNEKHTADSVTFKVLQKDSTDPNAEEKLLEYNGETEFTLNEGNGWKYEFKNLLKSSLGHELTYRVVETNPNPNYKVTYSDLTTDKDGKWSITIKNGEDLHLSVQKKWYAGDSKKEIDGSEIGISEIQVELWRHYERKAESNARTVTFVYTRNNTTTQITTQKVDDGGSITFWGQWWYWQKNQYRKTSISSVSIAFGTAGNPTSVNGGSAQNNCKVFTISNIRSDITVKLNIDNANTIQNVSDGLRITDYTEPTETPKDQLVDTVTLKKNDWSYSWNKQQTPTSDNRYTYTYYVKEVTKSNTFTVSYENNEGITDGTMTISNQLISYEMPHTGGIGTTKYTLGGIALMGFSLLFGFYLRRSRERRIH